MADPEEIKAQAEQETIGSEDTDVEKGHAGEHVDPSALTWDSPSDPDNPRNWPIGSRIFHTIVPALFGFVLTVATSVYVPAIFLIVARFNVSRIVAVLPLSLYTLGLGIGPLVQAPLSEIYGRRIMYWTTIPLLFAFTAGAGAAPNIQTLIIMRFLAGVLGSGAIAIGAGSVVDVWDPQTTGGPASLLFILGPFLGTGFGPLTGAYIIHQYNNDWRWSMWVIILIGAPAYIMALFMKETASVQILEARARRRGTITKSLVTREILMQRLRIASTRPIHMMFSFFGSFTYVFFSVYHFNSRAVGLTFLAITLGFFLAIISFIIIHNKVYLKAKAASNNRIAPEHRLYAAMLGSILLPIGLFWWAWAPAKNVHWIVPVLAGVPFGWGALAIFLSSTLYLVDVYAEGTSASALAANGILRYGLGAAFPLFTVQMYESVLGIHWAGSIFAFISVLMMPLPWLFFKYGKHLRARSGYKTSDF